MTLSHILYNDGNRCVFYVITVFTCAHTLTHIYPLGKKKIELLVMVINSQTVCRMLNRVPTLGSV